MSYEKENFYSVLGCEENASVDVIRRCYHMKALLYHPDKESNNGNASGFDVISKAWKTLSDPEARRVYDAQLNECRFAKQSILFGTFNVSDLMFDKDNNAYSQLCKCGGTFVLSSDDLILVKHSDISIECDACSLVIIVNQM